MDPLKSCNLCGTTSNDTAVFSCTYAKGELAVCLACLAEGIVDITKPSKPVRKSTNNMEEQEFSLEEFETTAPDEVFGFNCEDCGSVLFSNSFPVNCECGHQNNDLVLQKQNLMNRK